MIRVYLDQNKWIDLARAATNHESGTQYRAALDAARAASSSDAASFPLDLYRYEETGKRGNAPSRTRLADFMFELSQQSTMARPNALLPGEIDRVLNQRFGRPAFPRRPEVFGVGISHMASSLSLPPLDLSPLPEGHPFKSGDLRAALEHAFDRAVEHGVLRAGPEMARSMGLDVKMRAVADQYVAYESSHAESFERKHLTGDDLEFAVRLTDFANIKVAVVEALERVGLTWAGFIYGMQPSDVMSFMGDLPTRNVTNVLRAAKFRQKQKWERNDWNDIEALAVAVVHCDVVVTEKQWVHHLHQAGVDERYGTTLLSDTSKLAQVLDVADDDEPA
jgi:hypothetical protein